MAREIDLKRDEKNEMQRKIHAWGQKLAVSSEKS
jgi:hypothetical protein